VRQKGQSIDKKQQLQVINQNNNCYK